MALTNERIYKFLRYLKLIQYYIIILIVTLPFIWILLKIIFSIFSEKDVFNTKNSFVTFITLIIFFLFLEFIVLIFHILGRVRHLNISFLSIFKTYLIFHFIITFSYAMYCTETNEELLSIVVDQKTYPFNKNSSCQF